MFHRLLSPLFALLLVVSVAAQGLPGVYERADNPHITLVIVAVPGLPGHFVAWPEIDGNIAVGEEMLVVGFGPWQYENARGNQGTLTMNDLGDLTSEVTSGPFLGTKYSWLRLP